MTAKIYRPAKTAMQSGQKGTQKWILQFEPAEPKQIEPLMGWTSSGDMTEQVRLSFDSRDEAIAYAQKNGIPYRVEEPKEKVRRGLSYSENFRFDRTIAWTH